ncbi:MAG: hypothetical protein IJ666_05110 [Ruminococcus sp.]|nr:hypothetical protein [Ruminococcus sp.]
MKVCPKCGIENLDDARFCFFCDFDFYANAGINLKKPQQTADNSASSNPKAPVKKLRPVRNSNSQTAEIPIIPYPTNNSTDNANNNTYNPYPPPYNPPPPEQPTDYGGDEAEEEKSSSTPILIAVIALLICAVCILMYMLLIQKKMNETVENRKNNLNSSVSEQVIPVTQQTTSETTTAVSTTTSTSSTSSKSSTSSTTSGTSKTSKTTAVSTSTTASSKSGKTTAASASSKSGATTTVTSAARKTTAATTAQKQTTVTTTAAKPSVSVSAEVTACNIHGRINTNGGVVASFASSYVVDGGDVKKVRSSLGNNWNVTAVNSCVSHGVTWYEIYDADDNDYYGWVDGNYIDFTSPRETKLSVTVTPCNLNGVIRTYGGTVSGYASSYVVDGGSAATVRSSLGNWNIKAVNICYSMGVTWYELYDADDGDYYGWVDAGYIDFSVPRETPVPQNNSVSVTPCNFRGIINTGGGTVSGYASSYVVDGGSAATVRSSLGNWNVIAVNTCVSHGITWYELYDADDGDYYGWVDAGYINFS